MKGGSSTDINGVYVIQAHKNDVLQFSSASYTTSEKKVTGPEMNVTLLQDVKPLEALMIGGNFGAIKRKTDATAVTIIDSKTLERLPVNTLDQVFRGLVPGTNTFDLGDKPEGLPSLAIRGSTGDFFSAGAVYVDGVEFSGGSFYLSQLDKNNIDRVEVVRGPGAATMYGTGSIGGIIQIFTKKVRPGTTSINLTTGAGFYKSKWVEHNAFQQLHNLEIQTTYKNLAFTLGGSYRTVGAYLPDGGEKNKAFYAGAALNQGKLRASMALRYINRDFFVSRFPAYDTAIHPRIDILIDSIPAYQWLGVEPIPSNGRSGLTQTLISSSISPMQLPVIG